MRWICEFTWESSFTRWCNYLTALEEINYMPIRKDMCCKNYGSLHSLKGKV